MQLPYAFGELDVEEYEIVAALDGKTSEVCQQMDGQYINYFGESGAVYKDVKNKKIKTAFRNKGFDSKTRKLIEVMVNGRYN